MWISLNTQYTIGNFNTNTLIELQFNKLTRIESNVFQKILRNGGTIDVKGSKQKINNTEPLSYYQVYILINLLPDLFNCEDDPCHLAWIFNEDLLNLVKNGQCSNGTSFKDLDMSFYADFCNVRNPSFFLWFYPIILNHSFLKGFHYNGI